jgi:TM2 domain-containing membrane protein YozV
MGRFVRNLLRFLIAVMVEALITGLSAAIGVFTLFLLFGSMYVRYYRP